MRTEPLVPKTLGLPSEQLKELQRRADLLNKARTQDRRPKIRWVRPWGIVTWAALLRHAVQFWIDNTEASYPSVAPKKKAKKKTKKKAKKGGRR